MQLHDCSMSANESVSLPTSPNRAADGNAHRRSQPGPIRATDIETERDPYPGTIRRQMKLVHSRCGGDVREADAARWLTPN